MKLVDVDINPRVFTCSSLNKWYNKFVSQLGAIGSATDL